jgi:arylsulfatase A-like enzyme
MRAFSVLLLIAIPLAAAEPAKPNIVFIVADDCGYKEFSFQGGSTLTPRIDSIAKGGVRLTQGYVSSSVCSPSRAGLLTGRYQQRFGHHGNLPFRKLDVTGLPTTETLLPALLKPAGYRTIAVGKWHLGWDPKFRPCERGFDDFYGFLHGARNYFPLEKPPYQTQLMLDRESAGPEKFAYITDELGERAAGYIEKNKSNPFFLYLAYNATHSPQDATPEDLKTAGNKRIPAMALALDRSVGKVLDALDKHKLAENTLVVFLVDNGGEDRHDNTPLRGFKHDVYEGGIRVPFAVRWPGVIPAGSTCEHPVIALDLFTTALAAAGVEKPADKPIDGVNLLPVLTGKAKDRPHQTLFWSFGTGWAVRDGDLKLVLNRDNKGEPELYDLAKDVSEKKNLAAAQPEDVARLKTLYESWKKTHKPSPWGKDAAD